MGEKDMTFTSLRAWAAIRRVVSVSRAFTIIVVDSISLRTSWKKSATCAPPFVHHVFTTEDYTGRFDAIHGHEWLVANALIKQGRGHRCVHTIHSTEYGCCGNKFWNGQSARVREEERGGTCFADRINAVSNRLRDEIMWMYEVSDWKIFTVYNGSTSITSMAGSTRPK